MDILETITANTRREVAWQKQTLPVDALLRLGSPWLAEAPRSMRRALAESETGIIAEFKRRSPSKGWLHKDFIVDEYQLYQARTSGASAVLLIAAVLSPDECRRLARTAHELELEVLLEVHTPSELSHLNQYVDMLGVNNRDLGTFHTDVENSLRMIDLLRRETDGSEGPLLISESGISDPQTVLRLREASFRGFLMGEAFMKTGDPGRALAEFVTRLKTPQS